MAIKGLEKIIDGHRLFAGLGSGFLELITGCAKNVHFTEGKYLFREGAPSNDIYLVREGRVGLEISSPEKGRLTFQTAGPHDVIGLAWLVPPYRWSFDARAITDIRAISIDATCLRNKCEADNALGYEVMKRFMPTIVERLHATRLQILDVYGTSN